MFLVDHTQRNNDGSNKRKSSVYHPKKRSSSTPIVTWTWYVDIISLQNICWAVTLRSQNVLFASIIHGRTVAAPGRMTTIKAGIVQQNGFSQ